VIALPPLLAGPVQLTDAWPLPAMAVTAVGAPGVPTGVTAEDGAEAALLPTLFVACTENVYAVPFVSPLTTTLVALAPSTVAVLPSGLDIAVYERIALPPLDPGSVQLTDAWPLPAMAVTAVGAPGAFAGAVGVTAAEGSDAVLLPTLFVATTVNVYAVPFVSPPTTMLVALAPFTVAVLPSGLDAAVYDRIALPPLDPGSVQLTVACPFPATALTPVGAPGTVAGAAGVTAADGVDSALLPTLFVATTVKV